MATNNFCSHENGIFVVEGTTFEWAKGQLEEWNEDLDVHEKITDDQVYDQMDFMDEQLYSEFLEYNLKYGLEEKGYTVHMDGRYKCTVTNKQSKIVAKLTLKSGYYSDAQVIVETDPDKLGLDGYYSTQEELLEQYTPHHQRLLKVVEEYTTPIKKVGQFSSGEAVYEEA